MIDPRDAIGLELHQIPACNEIGNYEDMPLEQLMVIAQWDEAAMQEVDRRFPATPTRASDFHYELRHPGHGDQSVHNPHKGAGWTPGGLKLQPKKTKAEWKAEILANNPLATADSMANLMVQKYAKRDVYKNGEVTIEVNRNPPKGVRAIDPKELEVMDKTAGAIVAKYPGELTVKYEDAGLGLYGKAEVGSRTMTISPSVKSDTPMRVLGHEAGNQLEYTMWHEAGHAIPMKGAAGPGVRFNSQQISTIESAQAKVASRVPNLGVGLQPGKQNIEMALTPYGAENAFEWHAEAFAIHNLKVPVGAFTKKVISEYATEMDWAD